MPCGNKHIYRDGWARFLRSNGTEPDRFIVMLKDVREAVSCRPNLAILQNGTDDSCDD
jgi:hypothetical protein